MNNKFWVFDTNTLLSALLNVRSSPAQALLLANETGTLLISTEISEEYFSVFTRPKFDKYLSLETRISFLENILTNSLTIKISETVTACRDPKDNMFLSLAVSAQADGIISGDQDLLVLHPFRSIPILNPGDFLNTYKE
ncbi:MAG: putative toxin-antitoxin system toxin component, PIN family [Bacteroidota bacterium]